MCSRRHALATEVEQLHGTLGVASWLLLKDISARTLVKSKGEEDVDPETLG